MAIERLLGAVRDEVVKSTVDLYTQGQTLAENADTHAVDANVEEIKRRTRQARLIEGVMDDLHTRSSVGGAEQPEEELVLRAIESLIPSLPPLAAVSGPVSESANSTVVEQDSVTEPELVPTGEVELPQLPEDLQVERSGAAAESHGLVAEVPSNGRRNGPLFPMGKVYRGAKSRLNEWIEGLQ